MRARNIKPGFLKNEDLAECEPLARLLFAGLWMRADREGRMQDRPKQIKADLLPYDDCDGESLIAQLEKHGFVIRYEVDSVKYLQVTKFLEHQNPHVKEQPSRIPAPEKPSACIVQEPDKPGTCPEVAGLDSLIPGFLEPPKAPAPSGADKQRKPRSGKRTISQIRAALGPERIVWWENFWRVYPIQEGTNPAMDAFERLVKDHDTAVLVWKGAKRYADKIATERISDPTVKPKWAQGWLNEERWVDSGATNGTAPAQKSMYTKDSIPDDEKADYE